MLSCYYRRAFLCPNLNPFIIRTTVQTLTVTPSSIFILQHFFSSSKQSFTVNYLIKNCEFSPETASKLSTQVKFRNSENPDSVLAFFKSHGFSNPQIFGIIKTCPKLLSSDPNNTILPKFNFLLSKGASSSDLIQIVTNNPRFLQQSLDNTISPCYDYMKRFLVTDEYTLHCVKYCTSLLYRKHPEKNVQLLLQNGVPESKVAKLFHDWYYAVIESPDKFEKAVEEVKKLGFNPKSTLFCVAIRVKIMGKPWWKKKIGFYMKWGWSEKMVVSAFVRYPWCMMASKEKIEAVMEFFVNQMGWDSLMFVRFPILLMLSLEKRLIPRAFVLQYLESKGLIKDAKSVSPFRVSEKLFLEKFVNRFQEEASQLSKLYEEKRNCPS